MARTTQPADTAADSLAERGRAVVRSLMEERFDETVAYRSPEDEPGPEVLPEAWDELTSIFGDFQAIESVDADQGAETATVWFTLSGGRFRADLEFEDGALVDCPIEKVESTSRLDGVKNAGRILRYAAGNVVSSLHSGGTEEYDTPTARTDAVRRTLDLLAAGDYGAVAAQFTDDFRSSFGPEELAAAWDQYGCSHPDPDRVEDDPEAGVAYADFHNGTKPVRLRLHFDDGGVSGLVLVPPRDTSTTDYEPPAYADESSFTERDVSVADDCSGTLTVPDVDDPVPGVVLVHGSGPSDRDGTFGGNRFQQDLAWGLASRDVAVLRYSKPVGADEEATADDRTVDDAVAATEFLDDREEVSGVYLVGHSLGGFLLPRILDSVDATGGVALAAPSRPWADLFVYQTDRLLDADPEPERRRELEGMHALAERIAAGDVPADTSALGYPPAFWRDIDGYDPVETATGLEAPLFVAHAGRDWRIPHEDFERWRDALGADCTRRYPELDYVFAYTDAERTSAGRDATDVARTLVADVAAWLHARDDPTTGVPV